MVQAPRGDLCPARKSACSEGEVFLCYVTDMMNSLPLSDRTPGFSTGTVVSSPANTEPALWILTF